MIFWLVAPAKDDLEISLGELCGFARYFNNHRLSHKSGVETWMQVFSSCYANKISRKAAKLAKGAGGEKPAYCQRSWI